MRCEVDYAAMFEIISGIGNGFYEMVMMLSRSLDRHEYVNKPKFRITQIKIKPNHKIIKKLFNTNMLMKMMMMMMR